MKKTLVCEIDAWFGERCGGKLLVERYTRRVDDLLRDIFKSEKQRNGLVLIATGGYGRGELAPASDIDIMFFAPDRTDAEAAERILHRLWDTGLDISHAFRTPGECIEEAFKDVRTRTALLESRYVAGDSVLFESFRRDVYREIVYQKQKEFVGEKLREMERRHQDSGRSVYLLEPHIKEGEGGLRDVHTAYWIAKVSMRVENMDQFFALSGPGDHKRFMSAYDFLLRSRFALHLECKRKNDVLSFEYQRGVSAALGFRDSRAFSATERLMRYYYFKSGIVKDVSRAIVRICCRPYVPVRRDIGVKKLGEDFAISGGSLIATRDDLFRSDPDRVLEAFHLYAKRGKKFSQALKEQVRTNLLRISRRTRHSTKAVHFFLEILKSERVYETLRLMHESGVLGRFVPEFGAIRFLVVHEPYHMYTVDEHTLVAIRNLEELRRTRYKHLEDLHTIMTGMEDLDALYLALLFHDIGKAAGRRHGEEGYKRLKNIMDRFRIDAGRRSHIEFLVKNHVLMSKIALRRETTDVEVIASFADAVGNRENLDALYLITYADMSAVHPGFWTSWKAYLLRELYEQTRDYLQGVRSDREAYIASLEELPAGSAASVLPAFIQDMPDRYLLAATPNKVLEDAHLVKRAMDDQFAMRVDSDNDGVAEVSVSAADAPGLFSRIVGYLSSRGLNIVNGRIFTGKGGYVLDKISVSNWEAVWWEGLVSELESGLRDIVVHGKSPSITRRSSRSGSVYDNFIELDNEASDAFTLVEILSPDRLGLLYDITSTMHAQGVNIVSARINTEAGLAEDVFYVSYRDGKLAGAEAQALLSELWATLQS